MSLRPYDAPPALRSAPAALANCYDPDDGVAAFIPDEVAGSRAVTQHLIEHGHRDIVMLTGTSDVVASGLRERGFAAAMASAGLPATAPITTGWEIDKGYAGADARPDGDRAAADGDRLRERPRRDRGGARGRPAGAVRAR